jgi:hypothetical protein
LYDNSAPQKSLKYYKVEESKQSPNITFSKNLPTRKDQACPEMRFLDSLRHRTGSQDHHVNIPVLGQKVINYEQSNEDNFVKKYKDISSFRTDLKNLVVSKYRLQG